MAGAAYIAHIASANTKLPNGIAFVEHHGTHANSTADYNTTPPNPKPPQPPQLPLQLLPPLPMTLLITPNSPASDPVKTSMDLFRLTSVASNLFATVSRNGA